MSGQTSQGPEREMTFRELISDKVDRLHKEADALELLSQSLPLTLSREAEQALRKLLLK